MSFAPVSYVLRLLIDTALVKMALASGVYIAPPPRPRHEGKSLPEVGTDTEQIDLRDFNS
jgi:hypothetical protein